MKTPNGWTPRSWKPMTLLLAALVPASCGWDNEGPSALDTAEPTLGEMVLSLRTPHTDDGAVMLEIRGPAVRDVATLEPAHTLFVRPDDLADGEFRVAVLGTGLNGALLRFRSVDETAETDAWSIRVVEVVDGFNAVRESLQGYGATLARGEM